MDVLYERIHLPVTCTAADIVYEVVQHLGAFLRMQYLRMELNARTSLFLAFSIACNRADRSVGCDTESLRSILRNIVGMAHPAYGLRRYTLKQLRSLCLRSTSVFPYSLTGAVAHLAA